MSRAKRALLKVGGALLLIACGSSSEALSADSDRSPGGGPSGEGRNPDAGAAPSAEGAPTATGIVLVHAAGFPSMRLCFQNFPELPPQPDSRVMPEANVVGVEVGSLVRIDPLEAPGKIYVIRESRVRLPPDSPTVVPCRDLIESIGGKKKATTLEPDIDYHVATAIDQPLGENKVSVVAITGCGSQALLNLIGLPNTSCGANWDPTTGNLQAQVVDLKTTREGANESSLPVQLFQMSQALESFKGAGTLGVTFGALSDAGGPLPQSIGVGALFEGGAQTPLELDQTNDATYGSWGFRVSASSTNGTFSLDQSLAEVQALSASRDLPTSYYRAASNYALLLLGDPTHTPTFADGGANPKYNPRQSVHILAVPVLDPAKLDAGADADASVELGDGDGG